MSAELTKIIREKFASSVLAAHDYRGEQTALIKREALPEVASFLKDDPAMAFDFLIDLSCVDYLKFGKSLGSSPTLATPSPLPYYMKPKATDETWRRGVSNDEYRFEVVYHFYSSVKNHRLRIKVPLSLSDPSVDSITGVWAAANWFEREVWDMFGIKFNNHPNLRRILMWEEFKGHALRKDYRYNLRQPIIGPVN